MDAGLMDAGLDGSVGDASTDGSVSPVCPPLAATPTVHEGDVTGQAVWTAAQSPHVVQSDVNVRDGAKLTIEPCAVVQFAAGASLNVAFPLTPNRGELVAEGTAERPIRFEGLAGARWDHLHVHAPGTAKLAYVTLTGGGGADTEVGETILVTGDGEVPSDPVLKVDHVTIDGSLGAGIKLRRAARFSDDSRDLVVRSSGSDASPYPVQMGESAIHTFPTGSYTGNRVSEVVIKPEVVSGAGGLLENATLHNRGVPYRVGTEAGFDSLTIGSLENQPAVTLTIEPGVTLKMLRNTGIFLVSRSGTDVPANGIIRAVGTAAEPIVFTSAQPSPAPGDWRGFVFEGIAHAQNRLEHVRIEYTGADCSCSVVTCSQGVEQSEGALLFFRQPQAAFLVSSTIANASGHGIVQGYDGLALDWATGNTFSGIAGCRETLPRDVNTQCPVTTCVRGL